MKIKIRLEIYYFFICDVKNFNSFYFNSFLKYVILPTYNFIFTNVYNVDLQSLSLFLYFTMKSVNFTSGLLFLKH